MVYMDTYFLSSQKSRPLLFGIPRIITCNKLTTHHCLYQQVWRFVSRLLSPLPPSEMTAPNHAQDCDDSLGYEYPFTLKAVQKDGLTCTWCPWYRFCRGCAIECGPQLFNFATSYIAVDWDSTALHLRYHASQEKIFTEHESLENSRLLQNEPIALDACLSAFIREEELGEDELYYCSRCKNHQLAAKQLQLWRLPPILIIHLKRFQFHNGRWVKSQKIVKFPFQDFDPMGYLVPCKESASCAFEMKNNYNDDRLTKEVIKTQMNLNQNNNTQMHDYQSCIPMAENHMAEINQHGPTELPFKNGSHAVKKAETISDVANGKAHFITSQPSAEYPSAERCVASSDKYQNVQYNLYALSCHTGILGGGHYVTYAKNPNNRWYCYNDSSCKEVSEDQVDTDTAYMLFYECQGLESSRFMPDILNKEPGVTEVDDDFDKELKKMCILQ